MIEIAQPPHRPALRGHQLPEGLQSWSLLPPVRLPAAARGVRPSAHLGRPVAPGHPPRMTCGQPVALGWGLFQQPHNLGVTGAQSPQSTSWRVWASESQTHPG